MKADHPKNNSQLSVCGFVGASYQTNEAEGGGGGSCLLGVYLPMWEREEGLLHGGRLEQSLVCIS
jgi:hypothetical protein